MSIEVNQAERKRAIRRSALWVSLVAAGFYLGFILLGVLHAV